MASNLLLALLISTCAVILAIILVRAYENWQGARPRGHGLDRGVEPLAFLFCRNQLADSTAPARALLDILPGESEWQRLMAWVSMRLPETGEMLSQLEELGKVEIGGDAVGETRRLHVLIEDLGDHYIRVILRDPTSESSGTVVDSLTLAAIEGELDMLRNTLDRSPMLAWREDGEGMVTWANSAYIQLAERQCGDQTVWPLPRLIDLPVRHGNVTGARRAQIEDGGQTLWFECHHRMVGDQSVGIALPADAAVRAERSLREFVHTLTKTFADLPIGMAIFDKDRALQLFNPALIDLTTLSAGFLTARPTLYAFLDRLREARMVPEPKDYRSWRNQMSTLESASASGHHVETWSLPGGQTYRVTGRPHPDGAVAFLFEDITSEISLTRKFRSDLSLGREVLDALEDAVAVFEGNGQLATANSAYGGLWDVEMKGSLIEHLLHWQKAAGDGPGLQALRDAIDALSFGQSARADHQGAMAGPSGELLGWSLRALMGGRVMVRFVANTPVRLTREATDPRHVTALMPEPVAPAASLGVAPAQIA
ncbi:PAS-domain containing protein [Paracoccus aminophilus]|uniref:PAS/PAC sensor domain-containing protein n=1 Tax=Paracoccus aminophilus JCM 7686 TaxID=1367847 RepID=S5XYS2_PARAH|nr:PAS-domain containing protein [Paracoccus aminophilus]AGT10457.1 PAS/PAC sensor domain-containing protein [Paracoccus aminophilus JCM 7686]